MRNAAAIEMLRAVVRVLEVADKQAETDAAGLTPLYSTRLNAARYVYVRQHGIPFSRDVDYTDAQIDWMVDKAMGLPVGAFPPRSQAPAGSGMGEAS